MGISPSVSSLPWVIQTPPRRESATVAQACCTTCQATSRDVLARFKAWRTLLTQGPGVGKGALSGPCVPGFLLDHLFQSHF